MAEVVQRLRPYMLGWKAYFGLSQTPKVWRTLDEWLRHRLRAIQLKHWRRGATIFRELRTMGASVYVASQVAGNSRCWWRNSDRLIKTVLTIAAVAPTGSTHDGGVTAGKRFNEVLGYVKIAEHAQRQRNHVGQRHSTPMANDSWTEHLTETLENEADVNELNDDSALARWAEVVRSVREDYLDENQHFPWIIGFSGGKDSTLVVHATIDALMSIPPSRRTRPVHVVSNDTLVESPVVIAHLDKVTKAIRQTAENLGLPVTVARTTPDITKSFWVLLIGKGYPSPNQTMRWCTDRLKIQPTSDYIKRHISESGAAIVVLGVRTDESNSRQRSIEKHQNHRASKLAPHGELIGALVYRPIVNLSTDDVWEILGTYPAPWGGTHVDLFQLYRDAEGGECPVVLSKEEAPGCGTPNSRFGCWTCTVVEKDKSLQGFIDVGNHQYKPLVDFRDWLKSIRNKSEHRQAYRRNGRLSFDMQGKHIPGPFTIQTRKLILERLLEVQKEFGDQLVSETELDLIYQHWTAELQQEKGLADG